MPTAITQASRPRRPAPRPALGADPGEPPRTAASKSSLPGQVVLVLQGGGALGAYQVGVYQALHEAGIEPDWVVGTSIGAINASLIAGNAIEHRMERLLEFWAGVEHAGWQDALGAWPGIGSMMANWMTVASGLKGFF